MKKIKVKGCERCPFSVLLDFSVGIGKCRAGGGNSNGFIQVQMVNIPDNCPLKKESIKIELDNENRS